MTPRGTPDAWSSLALPSRGFRFAPTATCPTCFKDVAVRGGLLAGHYSHGRKLCSASSSIAPEAKP